MTINRPNRTQEAIRQWIILIPLATSTVGAALINSMPQDEYALFLPVFFFIGALLVTAAMLHHRHAMNANLRLTDDLQTAHEQLDNLHQLTIKLNSSLDSLETSQVAARYTRTLLGVDACALWLRADFLSPHSGESSLASFPGGPRPGDSSEVAASAMHVMRFSGHHQNGHTRNGHKKGRSEPPSLQPFRDWTDTSEAADWQLAAAQGFKSGYMQHELDRWTRLLNDGLIQKTQRLEDKTGDGVMSDSAMAGWLNAGESAMCIPIIIQGKESGMLLVRHSQPLTPEHETLLESVAFSVAPALHNSLLYQTAAMRAEIDGLTGLYNHRAIQEHLARELNRVQRARQNDRRVVFAVATMDVNDFKLFNDTYGHAVGDQVLRGISDAIRQTFRAGDIIGRFGGDEFVVLLPDANCAGAEALCDRAIEAAAAQPFVAPDGSRIQLRLTCGVAAFPEDGETASDLLRIADARLYVAKRGGVQLVKRLSSAPTSAAQLMRPRWEDIGVLETLVNAIDSKDRYTRRFCEKVWRLSLLIGHQLRLPDEMLQALSTCSLVHDVGKIIVSDSILRKPGSLTPEERQIMQQHPVFGTLIVRDVPHLDLVLGGVRHHHENYDGGGYPDKLCGEQIPLLARILAVPIAFTAMTIDRSYRKARSPEAALAEIHSGIGTFFDPTVVEAFTHVLHGWDQRTEDTTAAIEAIEAIVPLEWSKPVAA